MLDGSNQHHWISTIPRQRDSHRWLAQAYTGLPKATPNTTHGHEYRTRTDKVDNNGKVTLRYASKIRHLGIGNAHPGIRVLLLIADNHVTTSDAETAEILTEHHLDASKNGL